MNAGYSFLFESFGGLESQFRSRDRVEGIKVSTLRRIFVHQVAHVIIYSVAVSAHDVLRGYSDSLLLSHKWRSWPANHVCQIELQGIEHYTVVPLFNWLTWWEVSKILCEIRPAEFDTFTPPCTPGSICQHIIVRQSWRDYDLQLILIMCIETRCIEDNRLASSKICGSVFFPEVAVHKAGF